MSRLSRLFRPPPPPPPTLAERIASLQTAPAEVIVATALGSDEEGVRVAAIRLLPDGDAARLLAGVADQPDGVAMHMPAAARQAAQARLAQLIDEGSIDFAAFCGGRVHRPETLAVAALCRDPEHLRSALARVGDPGALAQIVVSSPSSRLLRRSVATIRPRAKVPSSSPKEALNPNWSPPARSAPSPAD